MRSGSSPPPRSRRRRSRRPWRTPSAPTPPGRFGVELPIAELMHEQPDGTSWAVWLRVEAAGFSATTAMSRLLRSGSAGVIPAAPAAGGRPHRRRLAVHAAARASGSTAAGSGWPTSGSAAARSRGPWRAKRTPEPYDGWSSPPPASPSTPSSRSAVPTRCSRSTLPAAAVPEPGRSSQWRSRRARGPRRARPLVPDPGTRLPAVEADEPGRSCWTPTATASSWSPSGRWARSPTGSTVTAAGVLRVTGRAYGLVDGSVGLATRNKRTRTFGPQVPGRRRTVRGDPAAPPRASTASVPGRSPSATTTSPASSRRARTAIEVPLRVSAALNASLPVPVATDALRGTRGPRAPTPSYASSLLRPLGAARGRYQQHRLQARSRTTGRSDPWRADALLLRRAGDRQRTVDPEGAAAPGQRPAGLLGGPGPQRARCPRAASRSWSTAASGTTCSARSPYYVDNMYQPEYHRKPDGQVIVQTFHGYPFKQMGHPHWATCSSRRRRSTRTTRARPSGTTSSPRRATPPRCSPATSTTTARCSRSATRATTCCTPPEADEIRAADPGVPRHRGRPDGCPLRPDVPRLPRRGRQAAR